MRIKGSNIELMVRPLRLLWTYKSAANIRDLSINSADKRIVAADAAGNISVLNGTDGSVISDWNVYPLGAFCSRWSASGRFIAISGQDSRVLVYDAQSLSLVANIGQSSSRVDSIVWHSKEDQFLAGSGKTLKLWTAKGFLEQQFEDHKNSIADIAWNPILPDTFATCTYFGVKIWSKHKSQSIRNFDWDGSVMNLAYSPNARVLASGCQGGAVQAWQLPSGEDFFMSGYTTKIRQLAWDSTSRFLATGGGVEIVIWDFSGSGPVGTRPRIFFGHNEFVSALTFAPSELKIVSGDLNGTLLMRDFEEGDAKASYAANDSSVSQICFYPDGKSFIASFASGEMKCFSAELTY